MASFIAEDASSDCGDEILNCSKKFTKTDVEPKKIDQSDSIRVSLKQLSSPNQWLIALGLTKLAILWHPGKAGFSGEPRLSQWNTFNPIIISLL
jgi:hypothetical protein